MTATPNSSRRSPALSLLQTVAFVLGSVLLFIAAAMAASALVSAFYAEYQAAIAPPADVP